MAILKDARGKFALKYWDPGLKETLYLRQFESTWDWLKWRRTRDRTDGTEFPAPPIIWIDSYPQAAATNLALQWILNKKGGTANAMAGWVHMHGGIPFQPSCALQIQVARGPKLKSRWRRFHTALNRWSK